MKVEVNITGLDPLAAAITAFADAWAIRKGYEVCPDYEPIKEEQEAPKPEPVKATRKRKAKPETRPEPTKVDSATVAADKAAEANTTGRLGEPKVTPEPAKPEVIKGEVMPKELTRAEVSKLTMDTAKMGSVYAPLVVAILGTFGAKNAKGVSNETLQDYAAQVQAVADDEEVAAKQKEANGD